MAQHYLVTKSGTGGEDEQFFEDFEGALEELAKDGLELDPADRQESSTQVRLVYSDPDERLSITLWDDYIADTRYLEVNAEDDKIVRKALDVLQRHIQVEKPAELLARAKQDLEKDPKLVARFAFSAPEKFDAEIFDVIKQAIGHPSAEVRRYSAYAAGVLGWGQFAPVLNTQLAKERPGETKAYLENALKLCGGA